MQSSFPRILFTIATLLASHVTAAPTAFKAEVVGTGKPMILIPGLASSAEVWKETVARYCNRYQCHVLQLAGFAGTPAVQEPLLDTFDRQLGEYIDSNKLERPVIVGHSLGGFAALRFAAGHPEKISRLVIVDGLPALGAAIIPNATPEQLKVSAARMRESMRSQDEATIAAGRRRTAQGMVTNPADVDRVVAWGTASDRATVASAMHDMWVTDIRADMARIKVPTLVLGTWIGYGAPRELIEGNFKDQYRDLAGVRIEMSDKARHFIMYDDPAWMFERMDAFLGT